MNEIPDAEAVRYLNENIAFLEATLAEILDNTEEKA